MRPIHLCPQCHAPTLTVALTKRQAEVLAAMRRFVRENGVNPSIRELARSLRRAPSTALQFVRQLRRKGCVRRLPGDSSSNFYAPVEVS